jgi:AraC-like DNA-binding protein
MFTMYLATHMAVSVVAVVFFSLFLYSNNYRKTRDSGLKQYGTMLLSACASLEGDISQIYNLSVILQTRKSAEAIRTLRRPIPPRAMLQLNAFSSEIQPYSYLGSSFGEIVLYFHENELFVSNHAVGLYPEVFYDVVLRHEGIPYAEWKRLVGGAQFMNFLSTADPGTGEVFLDVMQDLPYYPNDSKVTLIARFNPARLTGGLELPIRNGALLLVTDSRGRFVHGVGAGIEAAQQLQGAAPAGTVRVGDRQYVPVSRSLRSINWRFDLLIPEELLQVEERRALANILINISAVLLSGLAMAIGFSFYNMIPLKRLMGALGFEKEPRARSSGNEFSMLDDRIRNLIANNRDLKEEIDRQTELGVDRFLHQLLTGSYLSLEEINTAARYSGISLDGGSYLVALIELGGYDSGIHEAFLEGMDATAIVVADFLSNKSGGTAFIHKIDFNRIALVRRVAGDSGWDCGEPAGEIAALIREAGKTLNVRLRGAVGNVVSDLQSISVSYYALLRQLQDSASNIDQDIVFLRDAAARKDTYYYPLEMENRLLNYILSGNAADASKTLDYLFERNREDGNLTMPILPFFANALKSTLIRAQNDVKTTESERIALFEQIVFGKKDLDVETLQNDFAEVVSMLCSTVNGRKEKKNSRLIEEIKAFIEANHQNNQLGLPLVASEFLLTESYLSFFYKNQTGENLSASIEACRLRKVTERLAGGDEPIKDIAFSVGYTNMNTFYKAFKRHYGISPKAYHDREREASRT